MVWLHGEVRLNIERQEMSDTARKIRLGAFIMATGHHIAAWRHPAADADAGHSIDHYRGLAQTAEKGLFDLVFGRQPGGLGW